MVARCGGEEGFYPLVAALLGSPGTWTRAPDIGHAIQQVGRVAESNRVVDPHRGPFAHEAVGKDESCRLPHVVLLELFSDAGVGTIVCINSNC